MDATKIGTFIAAERRTKGWTQKRLAEELQLTDKAVSRWETGKGLPDVSLLLPLAAALDVSVGELLAGERQPQPPAVQAAETRTAEQLVSYTRELTPQLRRRRICTVLAGGLLFAAAFLTLQFLSLRGARAAFAAYLAPLAWDQGRAMAGGCGQCGSGSHAVVRPHGICAVPV